MRALLHSARCPLVVRSRAGRARSRAGLYHSSVATPAPVPQTTKSAMSRPVHFEVHAENPDRAMAFYSSLLGWRFDKFEGPWDYWMITTGPDSEPGINGGMLRRQGLIDGEAVIAYVCTMGVSSLDETMAAALAAGGAMALPKMQIPNVGWLAYMKDTEGNIFGLLEPETAPA